MNTTSTIPAAAPRIARFEQLAFGMFIHWGLYSQLGRGEWVQHLEQIPVIEYSKLAQTFTAQDFDARTIARLARDAGMKYITLTTRHHDGFSLYDTCGLSDFDAPHSPAKRDLIAEFVEGCRAENIVPFFYHTTLDWRLDSANCSPEQFEEYLEYLHASIEVLCRNYCEICGLWFDGNWSRKTDWKEDRLYAMIRRYQPGAMIINNTGLGAEGALGHAEIDSVTFEQGLPVAPDRSNWKKYVAGEMCQTFNSHWGIGKNDFNYLSPAQIIQNLCDCRKVGANYLLNVGPQAEGAIPEYEAATLRRVGQWVSIHADAIYQSKPTNIECAGRDFVLRNGDTLFYFAFDSSQQGDAHVTTQSGQAGERTLRGLDGTIRSAHWLDSGEALSFAPDDNGDMRLNLTGYPYGSNLVVRVARLEVESSTR